LKRELADLSKYQQFLESVCKLSDEFASPEQIRQRFDNLNTTKLQLEGKLQEVQMIIKKQKQTEENFLFEQEKIQVQIQQETAVVLKGLDENEKN
jgi:hypothetical protein